MKFALYFLRTHPFSSFIFPPPLSGPRGQTQPINDHFTAYYNSRQKICSQESQIIKKKSPAPPIDRKTRNIFNKNSLWNGKFLPSGQKSQKARKKTAPKPHSTL
jgi:hypothetical protein